MTMKNLVLCAVLLLSGCARSLPKLVVSEGYGVCIHFRGEPKDLDLIAEAGFKFIRMDLSWSGIERKKGVYDFERSGYDTLTSACLKRGIRVLYILDYSNRLYEPENSVRTDEGRKAFAAFAEAAARHYAKKGIVWEVWNEPNISQFWRPQPDVENYCKLAEAAAAAVRKGDPGARVVAPATSTIPFPWLEECFKRGLLNWIDAVSVHPYRPTRPETVMDDYAKLRALIQKYAPREKKIPILSGEWGYSNINWDKTQLTDEQQAQYLVRELLVDLYQGVPVSIWYDWKNDGTDPKEREHNFGTVENDLKPKTAYTAAKVLNHTLAGYSVAERLDTGNRNDWVLKMKKGRNKALVFWTTGEPHDATLPWKSGTGRLLDMLGVEKSVSWKTGELKLSLSQSPQYSLIR